MKYMEKGGFQNNPLMKLTIGLTLLFLTGLWATNTMLYFSKMSLSPASVADYYRGSDEDFRPARTYQSMLEVTHGHLPIMAIVILLLTHLLIFAPFEFSTKVAFILIAFFSALANEASGWLIRFIGPGFAVLKIAFFLIFQSTLAFLIVALGWFLWRSPTRKQKAT